MIGQFLKFRILKIIAVIFSKTLDDTIKFVIDGEIKHHSCLSWLAPKTKFKCKLLIARDQDFDVITSPALTSTIKKLDKH